MNGTNDNGGPEVRYTVKEMLQSIDAKLTTITVRLEKLEQFQASADKLDAYKKWLVGLGAGAGVGLLIDLIQILSKGGV